MTPLFGLERPLNFGWYLLGSVIVIVASVIGQIPFTVAIAFKTMASGKGLPKTMKEMLQVMDLNLSLFLLLLTFVFAFAGFYVVIRFMHKQTLRSIATSRMQLDWKRVIAAFSLWAILTLIITIISYKASDTTLVWNFQPERFLILALIAVALIPLQTSLEEFLFRGYLMQGFAQLYPHRWFPLFWTSLIFGLLHITNPEVDALGYVVLFYYVGTGLFLGIITLMDEGMELALGFHAANNLMAALLITSDSSIFQTYAIFKDTEKPQLSLELFLPLLVLYPLLIFIFSKLYRWTDWKQRLAGPILIPDPTNTKTL